MKVGNLLNARPNWYDRNFQERGSTSVVLATPPHVTAQRFSDVVPAAKKFILEATQVLIQRDTIAAPIGFVTANIGLFCANAANVNIPTLIFPSNVAGTQLLAVPTIQAAFLAGMSLTGNDADGSTGGTMSFILCFKGSEFDA